MTGVPEMEKVFSSVPFPVFESLLPCDQAHSNTLHIQDKAFYKTSPLNGRSLSQNPRSLPLWSSLPCFMAWQRNSRVCACRKEVIDRRVATSIAAGYILRCTVMGAYKCSREINLPWRMSFFVLLIYDPLRQRISA